MNQILSCEYVSVQIHALETKFEEGEVVSVRTTISRHSPCHPVSRLRGALEVFVAIDAVLWCCYFGECFKQNDAVASVVVCLLTGSGQQRSFGKHSTIPSSIINDKHNCFVKGFCYHCFPSQNHIGKRAMLL